MFFGHHIDQLSPLELLMELEDLTDLPNHEDQTRSQQLLNFIKGPRLAQTWKDSLKLFQTNLEDRRAIKAKFLWAFWEIPEPEEDYDGRDDTDWGDDPNDD